MQRLCSQCNQQIPPKRLELIPSTTCCADCKSDEDVFKYKMKTVGFNDTPTIAKNKKEWELLRKQKAVKDI